MAFFPGCEEKRGKREEKEKKNRERA